MTFPHFNRRLHLYLGLCLLPWFLMYGASSIPFAHGQFFEARNIPELYQGAYGLVDVGLTYRAANDRWSLGVRAENLFDREYFSSGFNLDFFGAQALKAGRQRMISGKLRVNF